MDIFDNCDIESMPFDDLLAIYTVVISSAFMIYCAWNCSRVSDATTVRCSDIKEAIAKWEISNDDDQEILAISGGNLQSKNTCNPILTVFLEYI